MVILLLLLASRMLLRMAVEDQTVEKRASGFLGVFG
jgi:hypothetical protein